LPALICIALLAGCGSPGADTAFKAPNGWKSTPGMFGRFQMWITGNSESDRQIVMLVRGDNNSNFNDTTTFGNTRNMTGVTHRAITLCGSQRADSFTGRGEGGSGSKRVAETVEGVVTTIGNSKYAALYIRPAGMQADAQAESALHSLCPLK
jgi:hypothetical protein